MKNLSETWFAEGYIDFELKKYTLLAYLQQLRTNPAPGPLRPRLARLLSTPEDLLATQVDRLEAPSTIVPTVQRQ